MGVTGMAKSHFCQPFGHKSANLIISVNFKFQMAISQPNQKSVIGIFAWAPDTRYIIRKRKKLSKNPPGNCSLLLALSKSQHWSDHHWARQIF
jgi:hypothetical protein